MTPYTHDDQYVGVECPRCGMEVTVHFWSEDRPYGNGVAYEQMGDIDDSECACPETYTTSEEEVLWDRAGALA